MINEFNLFLLCNRNEYQCSGWMGYFDEGSFDIPLPHHHLTVWIFKWPLLHTQITIFYRKNKLLESGAKVFVFIYCFNFGFLLMWLYEQWEGSAMPQKLTGPDFQVLLVSSCCKNIEFVWGNITKMNSPESRVP